MSGPLAAQASARVLGVTALAGPGGAWARARSGLSANAARPAAINVASRMKASLGWFVLRPGSQAGNRHGLVCSSTGVHRRPRKLTRVKLHEQYACFIGGRIEQFRRCCEA